MQMTRISWKGPKKAAIIYCFPTKTLLNLHANELLPYKKILEHKYATHHFSLSSLLFTNFYISFWNLTNMVIEYDLIQNFEQRTLILEHSFIVFWNENEIVSYNTNTT